MQQHSADLEAAPAELLVEVAAAVAHLEPQASSDHPVSCLEVLLPFLRPGMQAAALEVALEIPW